MKECNIHKNFFKFFLYFYIFICGYLIIFTPITTSESNLIYSNNVTISSLIANLILKFNHTIILPRFIFFIISIVNVWFLYIYSKYIFTKRSDSYLTILVYLLIPGVFVSNIVINWATIPIFLSLLFVISTIKGSRVGQVISLVLLFFTHTAFFVFYIAIFLYSYKRRIVWLMILSLILFILSTYFQIYDLSGVPKGHLLQLLGIYAVTLSPFFFLALIYSLYRLSIDKQRDILWYISTTSFIISLLLSIRQKILVIDFTPYIVIATPLSIKVFKNSLAIRLREFRGKYHLLCKIVILVLLLETSIIALNYPIYRYFGKKIYFIDSTIYDVAKIAKKSGKKCINNIKNYNKNLYKFYNIYKCNN